MYPSLSHIFRGPYHCAVCELSFPHSLSLDIHKKGSLHKDIETDIEPDEVDNSSGLQIFEGQLFRLNCWEHLSITLI